MSDSVVTKGETRSKRNESWGELQQNGLVISAPLTFTTACGQVPRLPVETFHHTFCFVG